MARTNVGTLTPRECEIAQAFAAGSSSRQIAARLGIAQSTVRSHLLTIYGKLEVSTKIGLAEVLRAAAAPAPRDGRPARIAVVRAADPTAGEAGLRLAGAAAQAVTVALHAYPDVRVVIAPPGALPQVHGDFAATARLLQADYLALPTVAVFGAEAELLLHLLDDSGGVRAILRRMLALSCPQERLAEAAEAFATQAAGMSGEIVRLERWRRLREDATPADAYGLYLAADEILDAGDGAQGDLAVALAERAAALDPRFSRGWLMIAWTRHWRASRGGAAFDSPAWESALFRRAAALAPRDGLPLAYLALSRAKAGAQGEAERLTERAWELSQRVPDAAVDLSIAVATVLGEPERALRMVEDALDRCPAAPLAWKYMEARAAFFAGLHERALEASYLAPDWVPNLVVRTLAAAELGEAAETRRAWARLDRLAPGFDFCDYARRLPITHPRARTRYDAAVRRAAALVGATGGMRLS